MHDKDVSKLRDLYDNTDTSDFVERAAPADFGDRSGADAMSAFTVRLPTAVLEAVREIAREENVATGVVLRRFIEAGIAETVADDAVIRVRDVRSLIAGARGA